MDRKETFNKLNQMSTKPSASASTVGVAVNGFLLLSNNSAYHLCATQADLYKWNGRSQVMHVELSPIKQSCVRGLPPNKETQLATREERKRRKVVLQQKNRDQNEWKQRNRTEIHKKCHWSPTRSASYQPRNKNSPHCNCEFCKVGRWNNVFNFLTLYFCIALTPGYVLMRSL